MARLRSNIELLDFPTDLGQEAPLIMEQTYIRNRWKVVGRSDITYALKFMAGSNGRYYVLFAL